MSSDQGARPVERADVPANVANDRTGGAGINVVGGVSGVSDVGGVSGSVIDVVIVGAGIAGLSLAGELRRAGRQVLVLERSRGVGGRCATRRTDGGPIDHGLTFIHGRSPQLRHQLDAVPDVTRVASWP